MEDKVKNLLLKKEKARKEFISDYEAMDDLTISEQNSFALEFDILEAEIKLLKQLLLK